MKIGPFAFWVISPFGGVQLWTYYCVLNASDRGGIVLLSRPCGYGAKDVLWPKTNLWPRRWLKKQPCASCSAA